MAVRQAGQAVRYAAPILRTDREVALAAVRQSSRVLSAFEARLQEDFELVRTTSLQNSLATVTSYEDPGEGESKSVKVLDWPLQGS